MFGAAADAVARDRVATFVSPSNSIWPRQRAASRSNFVISALNNARLAAVAARPFAAALGEHNEELLAEIGYTRSGR